MPGGMGLPDFSGPRPVSRRTMAIVVPGTFILADRQAVPNQAPRVTVASRRSGRSGRSPRPGVTGAPTVRSSNWPTLAERKMRARRLLRSDRFALLDQCASAIFLDLELPGDFELLRLVRLAIG